MSNQNNSIIHHWWPVGMQHYWADKSGDVSWIEPSGKIQKKRAEKRKIGFKRHGHTMFRGNVWETNFEDKFDIDNEVHNIIGELRNLKPLGYNLTESFILAKAVFNKERTLRDMCKYYDLAEPTQRKLLLFIMSLLIRSPAKRSRYENVPQIVGLPPNEDIGKDNMFQNYMTAKKICEEHLLSNYFFVLMHSPLKNFIYGDGFLDWMTSGLSGNRVSGKTILPLTPRLCIYVSTPFSMNPTQNCASFIAAPWMVDHVNELTQIYSKDKIFFLGKAPRLSRSFERGQFLEHTHKTDSLIERLDEIAGSSRKIFGFDFPRN